MYRPLSICRCCNKLIYVNVYIYTVRDPVPGPEAPGT